MEKSILAIEPKLRPASPAVDIKDCDAALFPNISILLQTGCKIPVTSCECERSASILRRLNNYMRAPMRKDRLSHLVLLHIHSYGLGHCSRLLCSATPPSTSTGKSSAITVSLVLYDTVYIKGPFQAKRNPPRQKPAYGPVTV